MTYYTDVSYQINANRIERSRCLNYCNTYVLSFRLLAVQVLVLQWTKLDESLKALNRNYNFGTEYY